MDEESKTTTNLIPPQEAVNGRPKGSLHPATVKNSIYTDKLREEYHDPVVTVLCMTLPDGDARQLPWNKEKAEVLVKMAKFFHHQRAQIKTDGSDSDKVKSVSWVINMPSPDNLPIINGHADKIEDER